MLPLSLLNTAKNHPMLVELKNGDTYNGRLVNCNMFMNLLLKDVICTSRDGDRFFKMNECYIHGNNIKYLRLPEEIVNLVPEEQPQQRKAMDFRGGRGRGGAPGGRGGYGERGAGGAGGGRGGGAPGRGNIYGGGGRGGGDAGAAGRGGAGGRGGGRGAGGGRGGAGRGRGEAGGRGPAPGSYAGVAAGRGGAGRG